MQKFVNAVSSFSSPKEENSGRPIRMVYTDENGKFKMDPEAIDALHQVKGPIGVVSVCGRARQGKSFILNQLLGRSTGFQVASTLRPCTKGIWMWSAPLKRNTPDGTEYNLLLLDSEGIDAYDQTGTYSTQIFSLAILLSSMFIYNQMGGIDEAALDRLSLVTEMTKHIRVRASGGGDTVSEIGQFSPVFVWLLRDFYLDLVENNTKLTPRDYLELALRPVLGGKKDIASKNKIRESIRALFPDRECFALVRPLNDETDLQHLDQISLEKLRPEFRSGLDVFTKFVFERTKHKQVGGTFMTGPILACITKCYLDAINNGAVPTISSSWQSVEESECHRAYDTATEIYMSAFDRTKPPEEVSLREAHDEAVQKSVVSFNASAVGAGSARHKYEVLLQNFLRKAFEEYKRSAFMDADLRCYKAVEGMEKKLQAACQVPDAKIDDVAMVLDSLLAEYEASVHGPAKWQKLSSFLQKSLQDVIVHHAKKQIDKVLSEKSDLIFKCCSIEDKIDLLYKQLEASEKFKTEYQRHYEEAIDDMKKLSYQYRSHITNLESKCSSLEERCFSLMEELDSARQEPLELKRKYEVLLTKKNADDIRANTEISLLKSRSIAAEAGVAAAREQAESNQKEATEWKVKYDNAVREAQAALEKAATIQESSNKQAQLKEDALRAEFSSSLEKKEEEIKDKLAKLACAEQHLATLSLELKSAESKIESFNLESSDLKLQIKELDEKYRSVKSAAESLEREAQKLRHEKIQLEQKYLSELKRFEELQKRCEAAEKEVEMVNELVDSARLEALAAQNEKSDIQLLAQERHAKIESALRYIENLEKQKMDLAGEVERCLLEKQDAISKVALLEARLKEREEEIELLKMKNEQKVTAVQILESGLESKCAAHAEVNTRHEASSLQIESRYDVNLLHQDSSFDFLNEIALSSEHRTLCYGKRSRPEVPSAGFDSVQDMDIDEDSVRETKKAKSTMTPRKCTMTGDGDSVLKGNEGESQNLNAGSGNYARFTMVKLRQELTRHGFGAELLEMKSPKKKDLLALYRKHVLNK